MGFAAALKKDGNRERTVFNRFSYVFTFLNRWLSSTSALQLLTHSAHPFFSRCIQRLSEVCSETAFDMQRLLQVHALRQVGASELGVGQGILQPRDSRSPHGGKCRLAKGRLRSHLRECRFWPVTFPSGRSSQNPALWNQGLITFVI
jgi:hypothetical protein